MAATQRKGARTIAVEKSSTVGTLRLLPAGAQVDPAWQDQLTAAEAVGPAAMAEPVAQQSSGGAAQQMGGGAGGGLVPSPDALTKPAATLASSSSDSMSEMGSSPLGAKFKSGSTPREGDPDVSYAFKVTIDNLTSGMFSEVGGLSWKAESIPIRSGGNNKHGFHMRGPGKFEPLTLKRGFFAANSEFFDMLQSSLAPNKSAQLGYGRVNVTIAILNRNYEAIGEYTLKNAFIIEYSGLQLNSTGSQVGFEQIRMAYDYFDYASK
jgi:phage tail-like protein